MKIKIGISLVLALLIIVSAFTVIYTTQGSGGSAMPIDVSKKVWDGNDWADAVTTYYGETVRFNITITYYKNCEEGMGAGNIITIDTLPPCLNYIGNANYEASFIGDNLIYWNLSEDYGIFLEDTESISIEFDAEVIDYGEDVNYVEVTAYETACGWSLNGADNATVNVIDPLLVDKEVYDPDTGQWVDELLGPVKKVEPINFRITITYTGYYDVDLMKDMLVEDILPACCLEYAGNEIFTYPDPDLFDDPDITVSQDLKHVTYDWSNKLFNLFAGESIVIEFETNVVEYCYDIVINCANVELWNWPVVLSDSDCATVNCSPPDTNFEKKVWDPDAEDWVEEISVYTDDTVTFKIDLAYYGNYNLTEISILDQLHYSMEYAGNADPPETGIVGNFIWWNFTEPLNDSETITIEFDALAIGGTGSGPGINIVTVNAYEQAVPFEDSDTANVIVNTNLPPSTPDITGDTEGLEGQVLSFSAVTTDPDGDDIYYKFDWDDGTQSDWLGPNPSGVDIDATNSWDNAGTYNVKAKAKDSSLGEESDWSFYPVIVEIVEPPVPSLNVTIKQGISLSIGIDIENDGELDLNNIAWNITVNRIGLIQKLLWAEDDIIPTLSIGDTTTLTVSPIGFGAFNVTVKIDAPGMEQIEVYREGLIIWMIILL